MKKTWETVDKLPQYNCMVRLMVEMSHKNSDGKILLPFNGRYRIEEGFKIFRDDYICVHLKMFDFNIVAYAILPDDDEGEKIRYKEKIKIGYEHLTFGGV